MERGCCSIESCHSGTAGNFQGKEISLVVSYVYLATDTFQIDIYYKVGLYIHLTEMLPLYLNC